MKDKPKLTFAPHGYVPEWQHAPRGSGLPIGYFSRSRRRSALLAIALLAAVLTLALTVGEVSDEEIRVTPRTQQR